MAPRTWAVAAGIVLAAVVLLALTRNSLEDNDAYSSIAAALVAIGTAFAGVVLYLSREQRPQAAPDEADALAQELLGQWEPEIRHRRKRFGDQRLIPLGWTGTGIGPVRLRLDGRLDGNPDAAATRLADAFDQLPSRRLVVIGEPGSGKTFLGVMLTAGLLRRRTAGGAVPVFLSLSSWDPVADSLDDWLVRTLATTYYNGRQQAVRALLVRRLLLPVLDGLDELPDHARRRAVNRLNDVLDGDRPLVLTCRITEYEDLIAGGAPTLLRAPVVRINPVTTADVVRHLRAWPDIAAHVRAEPDGPVATALSTPLMLSLFAAAHRDRSPAELVRFTSRHAVEDHLVDLLVDTLYPDPRQRRWLTYVAEVLHRNDDHDFRWWQLARRTLSPWIAPVLGLLVAVVAFLVADLVGVLLIPGSYTVQDPAANLIRNPLLLATIFGVVVTSLWAVSGGREPGPVITRPTLPAFGRGVLAGTALVLVPGVPVLMFSSGTLGRTGTNGNASAYLGALLALGLVAGLGVGLHGLLAARTSRVGKAGPEELLRQDRRSGLASALVTGLVVGALAPLACTLGAAFGGHLGQRFNSGDLYPSIVNLHLPPLQTHVPWSVSTENVPALVTNSVVFVVIFAVAVLSTRAWTRFVVARTTLALLGKLPWRLMRFLAAAHERGLLRVTGGGYQFWHVRLQERLVMSAGHQRPPRRISRPVVTALAGAVCALAVVAIRSAEPEDCRTSGWSEVDDHMARATYAGATACFAFFGKSDWKLLRKRPADAPLLDQIERHRSWTSPDGDPHVVIAGELRTVDESRWHQILRGVAAAQEIHRAPLVVDFAHSDTGHEPAFELAWMTRQYLRESRTPNARGAFVTIDGTRSAVHSANLLDSWSVIGLHDSDSASLPARFTDEIVADLVGHGPTVGASELADGISDDECSTLGHLYEERARQPVALDLRAVEPTLDLFTRLSGCTHTRVIIDEKHADWVRDQRHRRLRIEALYVDDESATVAQECAQRLDSAEAVRVCVATLSAAANFRVRLLPATEGA